MTLNSITLSKLPWRKLFWGGTIVSLLSPPIAWGFIQRSTQNQVYLNSQEIPAQRVVIVFGASVRADGTPSPMLADRLDGAIRLYQEGQVHKILMTGDNGSAEYNEVVTMQDYALAHGVSEGDITLDYAGFSTYESCYRAREIFGVNAAILVTQHFHIARAVYTCQNLGLEAIGLGTPDWERYGGVTMRPTVFREMLACVKALLELHLLQPKPTFLGKFEGMR
jgi:vancomycin permeability regulator SanA